MEVTTEPGFDACVAADDLDESAGGSTTWEDDRAKAYKEMNYRI